MSLRSSEALARRLRRYFSDTIALRGEDYFYDGLVEKLQTSEEAATAKVLGSQSYSVTLAWPEAAPGQIGARCTCPYFEDGDYCKHLWAMILAVDDIEGTPNHLRVGPIKLTLYDELAFSFARDQQPSKPEREVLPSVSWRDLFQDSQDIKKAGERPFGQKMVEQHPFVVLDSGPDDDFVKFEFYSASIDSSGAVSTPRTLKLPYSGKFAIAGADQPFERAAQAIAALARSEVMSGRGYYFPRHYQNPSTCVLKAASLRFLIPSLFESGRVYGHTDDFIQSKKTGVSLALHGTKFGPLSLKVTEDSHGFLLNAFVESTPYPKPGTAIPHPAMMVAIQELNLIASPDFFQHGRGVGFIDRGQIEEEWFDSLEAGPLLIPRDDVEPFLDAALNQPLKIELPESLRWPESETLPQPKLELHADSQRNSSRYLVELKFRYGSRVVSYGQQISKLPSAEDNCVYLRAREQEDLIFGQLPHPLLSSRARVATDGLTTVHAQDLIEVVKHALNAGIPIEVQNKKITTADTFQLSVSSGMDWFDVEGEAKFAGHWVKYPAILESIRRGEMFVPLPDSSLGLISEDMKNRLEKLASFAEHAGDKFRFGSAQGLLLNALLEDSRTTLNLDAKFKSLRKKLDGFSGIKAAKEPASFVGKLRKYQRDGLGWLQFLESFGLGGILADDMGLGKTIQCLAFLESRKSQMARRKPSLLLAPKSLLENWLKEAQTFTPNLKVLIHAGLSREISAPLLTKQDLVVTTYQTMLRDIEFLREIKWSCIVADEAQAIKNPKALISKATKVLPAEFRLAMTGTPIENSVEDLFSISDFVNPGFLNGRRQSYGLKINSEAQSALTTAFKPVILRRTKKDVLKDLPEKTEQLISVPLESKQLKIYTELRKFYQSRLLKEVREKGIKKSQIQILAALTRLRQAALHPALIDPSHSNVKSSKFETVLEMLAEIVSKGHRVLIFSQFTALLSLLKTELKAHKIQYCYLDGQTTRRQAVVNEFKTSDIPVFLMSLKAGGVGLNLVEADYVFLLDPWWNPAVEAQAIDRVHRIGQKRAVNAYRFIAKNTVEEKILELQHSKRGLADQILGQKGQSLKGLTAHDIEGLFS